MNPYDEPQECPCSRDGKIPGDEQCEFHGCCRKSVAKYNCDYSSSNAEKARSFNACAQEIHLYAQQKRVSHVPRVWPDSPSTALNHTDKLWKHFKTFDGHFFTKVVPVSIPHQSPEFQEAIYDLLVLGKDILKLDEVARAEWSVLTELGRQHNQSSCHCGMALPKDRCELWHKNTDAVDDHVVTIQQIMGIVEKLCKLSLKIHELIKDPGVSTRILRGLPTEAYISKMENGFKNAKVDMIETRVLEELFNESVRGPPGSDSECTTDGEDATDEEE